jgi:hypothetical protein
LLATTAMGAIDTLQGSEYGVATRALCCEALRRAGSPQSEEMRARASEYVRRLLSYIRDPSFKVTFLRRRVVRDILGDATADALMAATGAGTGSNPRASATPITNQTGTPLPITGVTPAPSPAGFKA